MTAEEQAERIMLLALAKIRREHPSWVQHAVWRDDRYLESVMRSVAGSSRFRRQGARAIDLLKLALASKAREVRRSVRGFTNVPSEVQRVRAALSERVGTGELETRFPETAHGSPSVYFDVRGRGGQPIVIRVSDHPPTSQKGETLIDISPTGHSAFSDWFLQRLDELGVGD